jgi:hypothetical protein
LDTKLKNFKYSNKAKVIAYILILIFATAASLSAIYLSKNSDLITSKYYYDTSEFKAEFEPLVTKAISLNSNYEQLNNSYEIAKNKISTRIKSIQDELIKYVNFYYYIENSNNKHYFTNFHVDNALDILKNQSTLIYINEFETDKLSIEREHIKVMLEGTPYNIYAAVVDTLMPGDAFYDLAVKFQNVRVDYPYILAAFLAALTALVILFIYLSVVTGRKEKKGKITRLLNDRIFTDIYTIAMLIIYAISYQVLILHF